jgi:undecaprenyl-diphosphatase
MNIFAQASLFAWLFPRAAWCFFGFAAIIGYSRIYVGIHYPSDVAAGAVFGLAVGSMVYGSYCAIFKVRSHAKSRSGEFDTI